MIDDIKESYNRDRDSGSLIPFIGAGFTKNIDGYPDWDSLIKLLEKDLKCKLSLDISFSNIFKYNYLEATEYYVWKSGRYLLENGYAKTKTNNPFIEGKLELLAKIKNLCENHSYDPGKWTLHDILVTKFDKVIYTTNWDDTLEKANDKKLAPIYKLEHFRIRTHNYPFIIKFHGHYDDYTAESLIACDTDYLKRISEENPFDIKFKHDLLYKDFLFIGYSFNDPNVKLLLYQIGEILEKAKVYHMLKPVIYWISTEFSNDERVEMLTKRGIKPYFLLTKDQQNELKDIKRRLVSNCRPCSFYWKCDNEDCDKYNVRKIMFNQFNNKRKDYLKPQMTSFLKSI